MKRGAAASSLFLFAAWIWTGTGNATLLGLPLQHPILSYDAMGTTDYDATSDLFEVDATPFTLQLGPGDPLRSILPVSGSGDHYLRISIEVDDTGSLVGGVSGDDLEVVGEVDLDGDTTIDASGTLLTGEILAFGFADSPSPSTTDFYDFRFQPTGGLLVGLGVYGGVDLVVTTQSESSSFDDDFSVDFAGEAKGNLGNVPEPQTFVLLALGLLGLAVAGRRR